VRWYVGFDCPWPNCLTRMCRWSGPTTPCCWRYRSSFGPSSAMAAAGGGAGEEGPVVRRWAVGYARWGGGIVPASTRRGRLSSGSGCSQSGRNRAARLAPGGAGGRVGGGRARKWRLSPTGGSRDPADPHLRAPRRPLACAARPSLFPPDSKRIAPAPRCPLAQQPPGSLRRRRGAAPPSAARVGGERARPPGPARVRPDAFNAGPGPRRPVRPRPVSPPRRAGAAGTRGPPRTRARRAPRTARPRTG